MSFDGGQISSSSIEIYSLVIDETERFNENRILVVFYDSILSADAHALFAQQSAMAVSKHSAHCMSDIAVLHSEPISRL